MICGVSDARARFQAAGFRAKCARAWLDRSRFALYLCRWTTLGRHKLT